MSIKINQVYKADCKDIAQQLIKDKIRPALIYADIIYKEPPSATTLMTLIACLKPGGAFWLQTDQNSVASMKMMLDNLENADHKELRLKYVNWVIWSYDWGGRPKDAFGRKHDDILYYVKAGAKHTFNAKAVAIDKVALINSEKTWKIPTDVWPGNFYTTSSERVKGEDGKCMHWQKPKFLMERILLACTRKGDLVFEPYGGTATMGVVAAENGRDYVVCDTDPKMVKIGRNRLRGIK